MADSSAARHDEPRTVALSEMPQEELLRYGRQLGLDLDHRALRDDLVRLIRRRQELIIELDRDALMDIVAWSRRSIRPDAPKEDLVREITQADNINYESLSSRGLLALARLRDIPVLSTDDPSRIAAELRRQGGFWGRVRRHRRKLTAAVVAKLVEKNGARVLQPNGHEADKDAGPAKSADDSLKKRIEDHGLVGGLASRLRGAADDYVKVKLDEIEARIDGKLDQIDKRLGEWRDKEVANRLRILRITLIFTVLVALLSLGYNAVKAWMAPPPGAAVPKQSLERP